MTPYATLGWLRALAGTFGGQGLIHEMDLGCRYVMPMLAGGTLAPGSFASGAIGYGGVYQEGQAVYDPAVIGDALRAAERELGLPCHRLVLPPTDRACAESVASAPANIRATQVKKLPAANAVMIPTYRPTLRNEVRAVLADKEVVTSPLGLGDRHGAVDLVHRTQRRVSSAYLSPEKLVDAFLNDTSGFFRGFGCWHRGQLASVGFFLVTPTESAYYLNGWDDAARHARPNVAMLHHAFSWLAAQGVRQVDLGYSHSVGVDNAKSRWGTERQFFVTCDASDTAFLASGGRP